MKFKFATLFVLYALFSQAQNPFLDSLKNDLQTVTDDSIRFRLFDELAWTYRRFQADTALLYADSSLRLAERRNDPFFQATAYATRGVIKKDNGLDDAGVSDLEKALKINLERSDRRGIISNYTNLGGSYEDVGKFDKAIEAHTIAIQMKLEDGDSLGVGSRMSNLGETYHAMKNYEKATKYYLEGLTYIPEGHPRRKGIYNNLGITFLNKNEGLKAIKYFEMAIEGWTEDEYPSRFASTYGNIGLAFYDLKKYDSAKHYTYRSISLKKALGQKSRLYHPYTTLFKIFLDENHLDSARKYATEALKVTSENSYISQKLEAIQHLAIIEKRDKNHEKFASLLEEYIHVRDTMFESQSIEAAEKAEAKFQNVLKEKENALLKATNQSQKAQINYQASIIIGSIIVLLLLLGILVLLKRQSAERKKLLDQIQLQAEKLRELDQAKTRFFANISHDLRSPLSLILGAMDQISEKEADILDKDSKHLLDTGIKNGKRLLYLADEIMDLTRLEEGKIQIQFQYVKIVPYLRLLTKMFSSAADIKSIQLEFENYCDEETTLQLDPTHFEKVIYNLLSNAIKFTPQEGLVKVSLHPGNELIKIQIQDSGQGIPEHSQPYIFERYYQASDEVASAQTGVGIGLALVKELIELHHGTITFDSSVDGTIFHLAFPFKKNDWVSHAIIPERSLDVMTRNSLWMDLQEEKEKLQVTGLSSPQNAQALLIVEDHKELRAYIKSLLGSYYHVMEAANGSLALDILHSQKIDLVITDLMMPYMDGFEMIDQLKKDKELNKIPVLVLSARTSQSEKLDLLSDGASDVMHKPFDKDELMIRVKKLLEKEWDSSTQLGSIYGHSIDTYEKEIMGKLEKLILKRIDDPHLSVLDLADEMAASERKVYRMVKKISGLTPYELIKEIRWQYLEKYLLNNPVKTATEAAKLIGLSNPSSLASQYKKRFGRPLKDDLI